MQPDYTNDGKFLRSELNRIKQRAYLRELEKNLLELDIAFQHWKSGSIKAFELNNKIHRYYKDVSQALWAKYEETGLDELIVAKAVADGIINEKELSAGLITLLRKKIDLFKN